MIIDLEKVRDSLIIGVMQYANGNSYDGDWLEDKMQGLGMIWL